MYSTWLPVAPRGYCDRTLRGRRELGAAYRAAESDEWCDDDGSREALDLELGSEARSGSAMGGCGERACSDICEGDLEEGNEESDVRRLTGGPEPFDWLPVLCMRAMCGSSTMAASVVGDDAMR